ncbi:uncharacterized protein LOC144544051 [Carex rostrata]
MDADKIIQQLGFTNFLQIVQSVPAPVSQQRGDALTFSQTANGNFSVKIMFKSLAGWENPNPTAPRDKIWSIIWAKGSLPPRLRLFPWKIANSALPLFEILARRGIHLDTMCQLCKRESEIMVHSFFMCDFARTCWFGSPMAIRSDILSEPITTTIVTMGKQLTDQQWESFVGNLWGIWRFRNDQTYGGKQASVMDFNRYARAIEREVTVVKAGKPLARHSNDVSEISLTYDQIMPNDMICQVDGSWASDWAGGIGFVLTMGIELKAFSSIGIRSCCPMQSEAAALKEAVTYVQRVSGFMPADKPPSSGRLENFS